ncbi:MAG: ABC transporter, ATP-binding family protein, partial [Streptococcus parasanguinis DORA_23_24]
LPVSEHQILSAKILGAFVWSLTSTVVFLLSLYIIIAMISPDVFISSLFKDVFDYYLGNLWLTLTTYILNTLASILCIYLSISIGQLFDEYRTALAVVAYIVIQTLIGFSDLFLNISVNYTSLLTYEIVKDIILIVVYYIGTYYILKNKVNLQ